MTKSISEIPFAGQQKYLTDLLSNRQMQVLVVGSHSQDGVGLTMVTHSGDNLMV